MQFVLDSNEYLFAFGIERKSSCETLFQTLLMMRPEGGQATLSLAVGIAPVSNMRDGDAPGLVVNDVEDPVVSNSHAVLILGAFELGASVGTSHLLQLHNHGVHLPDDLRRQMLEVPLRSRSDCNLIGHGLQSKRLAKRAVGHSLPRFGQRLLDRFVVKLVLDLPE